MGGGGPERRILRKRLQGGPPETPPENRRSEDEETPTRARSQELPPNPEAGQPRAGSGSGASRLSVRVHGRAGDARTCDLHPVGEGEKDQHPVTNKFTVAHAYLIGHLSRVFLRPELQPQAPTYSAGRCAVSIGGLLLTSGVPRGDGGPGPRFKGMCWSELPLVTGK